MDTRFVARVVITPCYKARFFDPSGEPCSLYLKRRCHFLLATLKGLEPSTFAVTGQRATLLHHRAI